MSVGPEYMCMYDQFQDKDYPEFAAVRARVAEVCLSMDPPHAVLVQRCNAGKLSGKRSGHAYYLFSLLCTRKGRETGCIWQGRGKMYVAGPHARKLILEATGKHGIEPCAPDGGKLWTAAQMRAIQSVPPAARGTRSIMQSFAKSGVACSLEPLQIHNWVKRQPWQSKYEIPCLAPQPIAIVIGVIEAWLERQSPLAGATLEELLVLKTPCAPQGYRITEQQVYVPFAARGMLELLKQAHGKLLKVVFDAKQHLLNNGYGVLTLAFLHSSDRRQWTRVNTHGHAGPRLELHATTAKPFFQALVHTESTPTLTHFFQDAIWRCKEYGGFELKDQLIQLHKDYARGIEAARHAVFPNVRALDDDFHLMQNVGPTLDQKCVNVVPAKPPSQSGTAQDVNIGANPNVPPTWHSHSTSHHRRKPPPKRKGKRKEGAIRHRHKAFIVDMLNMARCAGTLSLFDILRRVAFEMLRFLDEQPAASYLYDNYFQKVKLSSVQQLFRGFSAAAYNFDSMLIAGHWLGMFGTYPGIGSGSQPIESVHSQWQDEVKLESRCSLSNLFPAMQSLYKKWHGYFKWGTHVKLSCLLVDTNLALVNGRTLALHGRSTAKHDFDHRAKRNYVNMSKTTGDLNKDGATEAVTTFYVMLAHTHNGVPAVEATIAPALAEDIATLYILQGQPLVNHFEQLGVISNFEESCGCHTKVQLDKVRYYLHTHAVVVQGHLQRFYWPRYGRRSHLEIKHRLCSCLTFGQHAGCEHKAFIDHVEDDTPGSGLALAPDVRPKGRKRKATSL